MPKPKPMPSMVLALSIALTSICSELAPAQTTAPVTASQARIQWMLNNTVRAYDAIGMRDPKWDDPARRTLEAAATIWTCSPRRNGDEDFIVMDCSDAAIKAGCRDPLVIYARARSIRLYGSSPAEIATLQQGMADAFRASKYSAITKCFGYLRAAEIDVEANPGNEKVRAASCTLLEEALALLPEVIADPALPRCELGSTLVAFGDASDAVEGNRPTMRERVIEVMETSSLPTAQVWAARGDAALHDAERAGGGGFVDAAGAKGLSPMELKRAEGRDLLRKAWELDPNDFETAFFQLNAEIDDSHGRAAMEYWFAAATKLDPDDQRPYTAKLNWLKPDCHGSVEEMLKFGRECAATGRWSGLVPLVLVDAHCELARESVNGYTPAPHREYFANNPKIWEEIKPIYDRYLQEHDASYYHKTRYAVIAAFSGKWKEANSLFRSMPSKQLHPNVLYDNDALDALVREAGRESRKLSEASIGALGKLPINNVVVSARWGGGEHWVDVTARLKQWVAGGDEFWADNDTLGSDPTPGWRKHLEITYTKDGKPKTMSIDEDQKVPTENLRP
jgi:hypothetical protein